MVNNDGLYYILVIKSIAKTIIFVTFFRARFDRRHGFHLDFFDEHIHVLTRMKSDVEKFYIICTKENWGGKREGFALKA